MSGMMEFLSPLKWFMLVAVIIIICDLRFGIRAAQYRKETIRTSRAVRRSINKVIDYVCWILLAGGMGNAFGIPLDIPVIPAMVLGIIYCVEINSCFNNYFESIGKKIKIDVFQFFRKSKNMIKVEIIEKKKMKILVDNGHGENTAGKRSPVWSDGTELREWEFDRDIAQRVYRGLKHYAVDVELIVKEDIDVPLSERVRRVNEIANAVGKNNCLLISIHANAGGGTGWEAFTSVGETRSDKFATIFYEMAEEMFEGWAIRQDTTDGDPEKESQFYILRKTVCPAVLTENFFMDTEKDCKFIMSEIGRRKIADFHVQAILNCIDRA